MKTTIFIALLPLIIIAEQFPTSIPNRYERADDLQFFKEDITISIYRHDTISVKGIYYFKNDANSDISTSLVYPFPVSKDMNIPHNLLLHKNGQEMKFQINKKKKALIIPLQVPASRICTLTVIYFQHVKKHEAKYILTTTEYWGTPLNKGTYTIQVSAGIMLNYISYESDSIIHNFDATVYKFEREQFSPKKDIYITWLKKGEVATGKKNIK